MPAIIPISAFSDNYIWLLRRGAHAAVVDPGDARPVLAYLEREALELVAILNTHHHADHVGGNVDLLRRFAVPVYGPARESIPGCTHPVAGGAAVRIDALGIAFAVLDVAGHTAGHVAYAGHAGPAPVAFVGDTLFAGGCGRLFEGTPADMVASLARITALPGATGVYCAHEYTVANLRFALAVEPGNAALVTRHDAELRKRERGVPTVPSTIDVELATNPFLRVTIPEVVAAAQGRAGRHLTSAVDVFATLREWKNAFR
jgi:hydroxyacylglutathione hydrolase